MNNKLLGKHNYFKPPSHAQNIPPPLKPSSYHIMYIFVSFFAIIILSSSSTPSIKRQRSLSSSNFVLIIKSANPSFFSSRIIITTFNTTKNTPNITQLN